MLNRINVTCICIFLSLSFCGCHSTEKGEEDGVNRSNYSDLVALFKEFREFQKPKGHNGVPDYTLAAMAKQREGLEKFHKRIASMNIKDWPIAQQVDYHLVRAEMNGLEFDHRVRRPWSRDPCFYLKSQRGAGPAYYGGIERPNFPLSADAIAEVQVQLNAVSEIYKQAQANLTEASGDLAIIALHFIPEEIALYDNILSQLKDYHPELVPTAEKARAAVENYGKWLEENKTKMTEPPGLGIENYNWWMKNVQLFPHTWDELLVMMQHEYNRAIALLELEQYRNRKLHKLKPATNEREYQKRYYKFQKHLLNFLSRNEVFTMPDYLKPYPPKSWSDFPGRQGGSVRDFFEECEDRNPLPSPLIHEFLGHHFDGLRSRRDDRPIRGARRLYAMDMIRSEGLAFGLEELFMHVGLFDKFPRAREINYIMMAFRAVRAIADLKLHSHAFTLEESFEFCYEQTPNHWMLPDGFEVWYEMETTLRFPGWHMGMVGGKIQLFNLLSDRSKQLKDSFNLCQFMDDFFDAGMIPIALTRWEITGLDDEVKNLR